MVMHRHVTPRQGRDDSKDGLSPAKLVSGLVSAGALMVVGPAAIALATPSTAGTAPLGPPCLPSIIGCVNTAGPAIGSAAFMSIPLAGTFAPTCGMICNGVDGTEAQPNGQNGGWLIGNGGNGYTSTVAGVSGGNGGRGGFLIDRKSTRLNSSHSSISYAVFCLKKKKT